MANLYMHQKKRGGIIDSNAEDAAVISIQSDDPNEAVSIIFVISILVKKNLYQIVFYYTF